MSVHTPLAENDFELILSDYNLGTYQSHQGVLAGVTNTIYRLKTSQRELICILYEANDCETTQQLLAFQANCHSAGVPCALPFRTQSGEVGIIYAGKWLALFDVIEGESQETPGTNACEQVGKLLAYFHKVAQSYRPKREAPRGLVWMREMTNRLLPTCSKDETDFIQEQLTTLDGSEFDSLSQGWVHADLFRDNAFFHHGQLVGIIDFDFASWHWLLFDLAVVINDWCVNDDASVNDEKQAAFIDGYFSGEVVIECSELEKLSEMRRFAAFQFYLSRLLALKHASQGEEVQIKDPNWFVRLIAHLV